MTPIFPVQNSEKKRHLLCRFLILIFIISCNRSDDTECPGRGFQLANTYAYTHKWIPDKDVTELGFISHNKKDSIFITYNSRFDETLDELQLGLRSLVHGRVTDSADVKINGTVYRIIGITSPVLPHKVYYFFGKPFNTYFAAIGYFTTGNWIEIKANFILILLHFSFCGDSKLRTDFLRK